MIRIGIDLGGTKTEVVALDARGTELVRHRVPTPRGDYAATVATIATLVRDAERELRETATVGVGTPGAISHATGRIKNANSTWLIGRPLKADIETALGREIRISNDANCLALSEATDGAAAGAHVVFAAILGTGVGGGVAAYGHVHEGPNAIAGEWGHAQLPWREPDEIPGPQCYCGKLACVETFLSGPSRAKEPAEQRYEDRLARGLAMIVNVLDPDVIVLGGGVSNVESLYTNVPQRMLRYVFSDTFATPVVRAKHGDSSGVRGAAMLWPPMPS
jgi:fructokinase